MKKMGKCPDCGEKYDKDGNCSCNKSSAGKKEKPAMKKGKKPNPFQKGY